MMMTGREFAHVNGRLKRSFLYNVWLTISLSYTVSISIITSANSARNFIFSRLNR